MFELNNRDLMNNTRTDIPVGPFTANDAKARRQEWYSFQRAHVTSLVDAKDNLLKALKTKDVPAQMNLRSHIQNLEIQYDTIIRYEVSLRIDLEREDALTHTLVFQNRSHRMAEFEAALKAFDVQSEPLLDAMPVVEAGASRGEHGKFLAPGTLTERKAAAINLEKLGLADFLPKPGEDFDPIRSGLVPSAQQIPEPIASASPREISPAALALMKQRELEGSEAIYAAATSPKPTGQLDSPAELRYPDPVLPDSPAASPLSTTKEEPST